MTNTSATERGSEWHRWEPHIHTPGTVLEDKYGKGDDVWERYLAALETATPSIEALGITDYCVTASYERFLKERSAQRLPHCKLVFPNIELRLDTGTIKGNFVNIHLLVNPEDPQHVGELNRFLGRLTFTAHNDKFACTPSDLMRLGRCARGSNLSDTQALEVGCTQFKVSRDTLLTAYRDMQWAKSNILIAVSANADGTSGVKEAADATIREELEKAAHAIFASSPKQRDFWRGAGAATVDELRARYDGPKPCVWGSDAHEHARIGKPDQDRLCWIKGAVSFDALKQACIIPDRAFVGITTPSPATASQIIDCVSIENAEWARTPNVRLNSGLIAIIGARGSGKTALADIIAAGCDAYEEPTKRPSFLGRAREYLGGAQATLSWGDKSTPNTRTLDEPVNWSPEAYPRARYLSQQFVEDLCFIDGMPTLIREIERVVYEAQPTLERDSATDFAELLEARAGHHRVARTREEEALAKISEEIGIELDKASQIKGLEAQAAEKTKLIARYEADRKLLIPKGDSKYVQRLSELTLAADKARSYLRNLANQKTTLATLKGEVANHRTNWAPQQLRAMKERYTSVNLPDADWERFLLAYTGDVDGAVTARATAVAKLADSWKGTAPTGPAEVSGAFIKDDADVSRIPLAVLEAEIARLQALVAADKDTANKLAAISRRISEEAANLEKITERLADAKGATQRAKVLVGARQSGYERVFDAIVAEEGVLNDLYGPIRKRLAEEKGTLGKLTFTVSRVVNVGAWAKRGEDDLFDLRSGPFRGIGSLAKLANAELLPAWQAGDASAVSKAMQAFRDKHQEVLLEKAKTPRADPTKYRAWTRQFAQWLYSTDHIAIEYGIQYDGIDIRKLSPGTRGIVLLLLYLALDDNDDRPLIIDQPEENLDPQSVNDELVPLFLAAKSKRQVIIVTHNANLVVNTDADQVIIARVGAHTGAGLPPISYEAGGLDEARIRDLVCRILEGGEPAFIERARRLRIALQR